MKFAKSSLICLGVSLGACLTACDDDTPPKLDTEGHWIVDHGFFENQCQVGATFSDEQLILTFLSLVEGACQPELYGIENNALPIQVDQREDYLDESGAMAAGLNLSNPNFSISGAITLTESTEGMTGVMTEAYHPEGFLDLLLEPTYKLSRVSEDWLPELQGVWATSCDQLGADGDTQEVCEVIEIVDATRLRLSIQGAQELTAGMESSSSNDSSWLETAVAMRNLEKTEAGYILEVVLIPDSDELESGEAILTLSDGVLTFSIFVEGDDEWVSIDFFRAN